MDYGQRTAQAQLQSALRLHQSGDLSQAEAIYRQVLLQEPKNPDALQMLGIVAYQTARHDLAASLIRQAISLMPDVPEYHDALGCVLQAQGKTDDAVAEHQQALTLNPNFEKAHSNLGNVLASLGRLEEAQASLQRALDFNPNSAPARVNLGRVLVLLERYDEGIQILRSALTLDPANAIAHNNLGLALEAQDKHEEALAAFDSAVRLKPDFLDAHISLGYMLQNNGEIDQALAHYRRAIEIRPNDPTASSNLLYLLNFHPALDGPTILAAHRDWATHVADPITQSPEARAPHTNDRNPDKRLRIGYVSPNFRVHAIARFMLPLLEHHDKTQVEVYGYHDSLKSDDFTARIRAHADVWRATPRLTHEQLAQQIRADQIDILIDLTLHMAHSRLLAFAGRPAPIQLTYLAYAGTSGLSAMDYRFTDSSLDPQGAPAPYSEESVRLKSYWCYQPPEQAGAVAPLPALATGNITFGCLNSFTKASPQALDTWAEILRTVPNSRLLLFAFPGKPRQRVREALGRRHVDPARAEFLSEQPLADYLRTYNRIDIQLDPFPYNGGTTTCDGLWMGVPAVTLSGNTAVGRAGVTLLTHLGMTDLIAQTREQYIQIAQTLATDLPRVAQLRQGLRDRMRSSTLCDANSFARDVEEKYRWMWRRWCDGIPSAQ